MKEKHDLTAVKELLEDIDYERIDLAKKRQAAVWKHEIPDKYPIILGAPLTKSQEELLPNPNFKEAFYDEDLMLTGQLRGAFCMANSGSDGVPSVRANMGTGVLVSCYGKNQLVFEDKMPWLKEHLTKEELTKINPGDIHVGGDFERGLNHIKKFNEVLSGLIPTYCLDTQGPLDIAHLLFGDDLFMEFYDDPQFVHHLMEVSLELIIKCTEIVKDLTGEAADEIVHSNSLYADNMGIRICEDTTAVIGPDIIDEFAMPYTERLVNHFGGAWIHYCGRHDHLTKRICEISNVRGINFGHIANHEQDHIFEQDMEEVKKGGKVYYGNWPFKPGENREDYMKRLFEWSSQGSLIPLASQAVNDRDGFATTEEALDYWYNL